MCVYSGCELEHWREPYKGTQQIQCFLHYVNSNGQWFQPIGYLDSIVKYYSSVLAIVQLYIEKLIEKLHEMKKQKQRENEKVEEFKKRIGGKRKQKRSNKKRIKNKKLKTRRNKK
jgi:poly-D-alanine transfer protein DltD